MLEGKNSDKRKLYSDAFSMEYLVMLAENLSFAEDAAKGGCLLDAV